MKYTYNVEEIFEEIPGDPDNVIMKIPPEILEQNKWKEGDTLTVTIEDNAIVLSKTNE